MINSPSNKPIRLREPLWGAAEQMWLASERCSDKTYLSPDEAIYQALFEASAIPAILLSANAPDFIFLAANDAYLSATQKTRTDLIGRNVFDVFSDDLSRPGANGQELLRAAFARVLETGLPYAMPPTRYDIPDAKGGFEERWWLPTTAPVLTASGQVEVLLHKVSDITAQHFAVRAKQERQAQEAFLHRLSDAQRALADATAIKETTMRLMGEHLKANRVLYVEADGDHWLIAGGYVQGVKSLANGRRPMDQFGKWIFDLLQAGQCVIVKNMHTDERYAPSQRVLHEAMQIIAAVVVPLIKDGALVAVLAVHVAVPRDWSDFELGLIGEVAERTWAAVERARSEATERRTRAAFEQSQLSLAEALKQATKARDQAEAAGSAKDRFLAILSHELRTPLTPILLAMHLVASEESLSAPLREAVDIIRRNVRLEVQLIDDLLDVTRISTGKMDLNFASTTLREILKVAIEVSIVDINAKDQILSVDLEAADDPLSADVKRLQQVFWNLLKNASKFTPTGGEIRLRSRRSGQARIEVQVQDNGIGFEANAAQRIFDAFEQGSERVRFEHGGLGLGLAIARASVEAHSGSIHAESIGIGRGATFTVELPFDNRQENAGR